MTDIALLLLLLGNFLNLILGTTYYNNISDADDDSHIYRKTTLFNLRNLKSFKFDYGKLKGAENYWPRNFSAILNEVSDWSISGLPVVNKHAFAMEIMQENDACWNFTMDFNSDESITT